MAIITFPDIQPDRVKWALETNSRMTDSTWTKTVQVEELDGSQWVAELSFKDLNPVETRLMQAFLWACKGPVNAFYLPDFVFPFPSGSAAGTPRVKGTDQTGITLDTDGWSPNSLVLKAGDAFEVDGNYRGVTADVTSDGAGLATIPLSHRLYNAPLNNALLEVLAPKVLMQLKDDRQGGRATTGNLHSTFSLSVREVL